MIKLQQKQVKIISILIAVVFVGSVVALALTQSGSGVVSAAAASIRSLRRQTPRCRRLRRRHRQILKQSRRT